MSSQRKGPACALALTTMETETRFPETRFRFHRRNEARSRSRLALTTIKSRDWT